MKRWKILVSVLAIALICITVVFVKTKPIFETDNVSRVTFYAYYGSGIGSDVPEEHLEEILSWLDSFTIGNVVLGDLSPGTNTVYVEIEYADGTSIKQGLDTATVGGIGFYTHSDNEPDCLREILSKTSLGDF